LPTIDPRNVASGIRRVLIAEPTGANGQQIAWISKILGGSFVTNTEKHRVALLAPCQTDGVVSRYQKSARTWVTATPVALPGCDDGKPKKRERLFFKAVKHAGYSPDALAQVEFHRVPFLRGAEYSLSYRPGRPHYLQACSVYHVRLRWKNAVTGPIAIGSGRHCGLGIFAALD
jgi:CRISPR-associated protein Csb2